MHKPVSELLAVAVKALTAIRDLNCPPGCEQPGPWDQHQHGHPKPEIIARDALRVITGRIEPESIWGDGTGGPVHKAPKRLTDDAAEALMSGKRYGAAKDPT